MYNANDAFPREAVKAIAVGELNIAMGDLASSTQSLRAQLQIEKAAREEHERVSAAKTRQLWLLREKYDREVKQYQDQLSVVRASLILAHKLRDAQQLEVRAVNRAAAAAAAAAKAQPELQVNDTDVAGDDVLADSPKKCKQLHDQLVSSGIAQQQDGSTVDAVPDSAVASSMQPTDTEAASGNASAPAEPAGEPSSSTYTAAPNSSASSTLAASASSAVLLAAAAKLQQVVEQLSNREPSVAADLSVLQWQLTATYGHITGAPGRTSSHPMLFHHGSTVCTGDGVGDLAREAAADQINAAHNSNSSRSSNGGAGTLDSVSQPGTSPSSDPCTAEQPAAATVTTGAVVAGSGSVIKPEPTDAHPLKVVQPQPAAAAAASSHQQHSHGVADIAAAARLFSGAATTLQAPQLDWYYLDGCSIRGPHDAALMIRWHCNRYLEDQLPVAGVLQHADSSSKPPAPNRFQPLRQLLQQVQQGGSYSPAVGGGTAAGGGAAAAGGAGAAAGSQRQSMSQVLAAIPPQQPAVACKDDEAAGAAAPQQQHQHAAKLSARSSPGLGWAEEARSPSPRARHQQQNAHSAAVLSDAQQPTLPVSTHSSCGGGMALLAGDQLEGQQQQQQQQLERQQQLGGQQEGLLATASSSLGLKQIAARLRDSARLDASPMRPSATSQTPAAQRSSAGVGQLMPAAAAGRAFAAAAKGPAVLEEAASSGSSSWSREVSSGGSWGITAAVQGALDSVGNAVDSVGSAVEEMVISSLASAAGQMSGGGAGAGDDGSALDFVSDFPQLFPAAVMNDVVQRHEATTARVQKKVAEGGGGDGVASLSHKSSSGSGSTRGGSLLAGVWRVESLHQMLSFGSDAAASGDKE